MTNRDAPARRHGAWRFDQSAGPPAPDAPSGETAPARLTAFTLAGERLHAHPEGALWLAGARALVVSDLHFEKGSAFAQKGVFLPPYDTGATLARLERLVTELAPRLVIALGDSFHDLDAGDRMAQADFARLDRLARTCAWVWIEGNHDPAPPARLPGERRASLEIGVLVFRHEPGADAPPGEVAGHLHPCAKVAGAGRRVRRRCFATDGRRLIMPAFGAYAGGLNVCDPAFGPLFPGGLTALALGGGKVHALAADRLLPD
jgi:DNA ligase-associated metallophosphoesterase